MLPFARVGDPAWHGNCYAAIQLIVQRSRAVSSSRAISSGHSFLNPRWPMTWTAGGCAFVEDSSLSADHANILWSASIDPDILPIVADPAPRGRRGFNLAAFGRRAAIVAGGNHEHVVIRSAEGWLRFDVLSGTVRDGPVLLSHRISGRTDLDARMPALRQLAAWCELGTSAPWTLPTDPRLDRLILALRVLDARTEGASLREVAIGLHGVGQARADWPGENESTKSWVRRLVALAEALRRAGPWAVLNRAI